jgi:hypothetical protein
MCLWLDAASIAVPPGDRLGSPAFSRARPGEGLKFQSHQKYQTEAFSREAASLAVLPTPCSTMSGQ